MNKINEYVYKITIKNIIKLM